MGVKERAIVAHEEMSVYHGKTKEYYIVSKQKELYERAVLLEKYHKLCADELKQTNKPLLNKRKKELYSLAMAQSGSKK